MPVRENSIHTPREEMAELRQGIEQEKEVRKSLRISASDSYYTSQKAYFEEQISLFQEKLLALENRHNDAENQIAASHARTATYEKRYKLLKNRDKIARIEKLEADLLALKEELGQ